MDSSTPTPKEDNVFNEDNVSSSSTIKWLRGPKLNGIAAFDLISTAMGAFVLSGTIKLLDRFKGYTHVLVIFILLIILAIGVHYIMEIPTMLNHYLGINTQEEVTEGRNSRGEH
jgi:hypothetical protein